MFIYFNRIRRLWNKYGFELLLLGTIIFIVGYWFLYTRKLDYGTYSTDYEYRPGKKRSHRGPPKCSKGEAECRRVLENYFKVPFPNQRPSYLINPMTNRALEIDCYNERLRLGCEYHGRQHFEYTPFMHKSREAFQNQKYRDKIKYERCKELGIRLIIVPYTIPIESIKRYIFDKVKNFKKN